MKERVGRQPACCALIGGLLLLLFGACGPGGEVGLRPAGDTSASVPGAPASSSSSASPPLGAAKSAETPAPKRPSARPFLLEPIVEDRPASANRSLGEEDLRNLGELGLLPHVVQSISTGAPCDFSDAMSNCQ